MERGNDVKRAFYVVQFIELPFNDIDDYVCVPCSWLILRMANKAAIAYPKNEDPFLTRDRVKRKERHPDEWKFYMALVKHESDTYRDAEDWIATRNDYGLLVEEDHQESNRSHRTSLDMPKICTLNKKSRSAAQGHSSKFNDNLREPLPKTSIKRPVLPEPKKQPSKFNDNPREPLPKQSIKRPLLPEPKKQPSKFNDNPREPLPKTSIKRPVLPEPKKQLNGKRLKLDEDVQSSSTVGINAHAEAGCSKWQQPIITQDNQTMECGQTKEIAAASNGESSSSQRKDKHLQDSLPMQAQQELNITFMDVGSPILVIDSDADVQANSNMRQQLSSNQVLSQFAEQPEPVSEPQISVEKRIRLMNMAKNLTIAPQNPSSLIDQTRYLSTRTVEERSPVITQNGPQVPEIHNGNIRNQTMLRSSAISSREIQHVVKVNVERSHNVADVDPRNVVHSISNIASVSQNLPSSSHQHPSFFRQLDGQQSSPVEEQYHTRSHQNQYLPTNQNSFEQHKRPTENNDYDHRPNSQSGTMIIPSIRQNSTHPSNQMYQTTELLQQQSQPNQLGSQRQPQKPKITSGISLKPKHVSQISNTLQGANKKTAAPIITRVLNAIQQALSTDDNCLLIEQLLTASQSESELINESHRNVMDVACQTDECMVGETLINVTSESNAFKDHEVISNLPMSTDEAPVETTNSVYCPGTASGSSSADRPTATQNSTPPNHQTHRRKVLEQQMLDHFAALFTQMARTLRYTNDMYNNLRNSIFETAEIYRELLDKVERFNAAENSANDAFPLRR